MDNGNFIQEKIVQLSEGKSVKVKELQYAGVKHFIKKMSQLSEGINVNTFIEFLDESLPYFCDLSPADLEKLFISDMQKIYDAFCEVNKVFFQILEKLGLMIRNVKTEEKKTIQAQ